MDLVGPFIPFCFLIALYAAYIKLSARLLKGIIRWRNAFIFAGIVATLSLISRAAASVTGIALPIAVSLVYGLIINIGLGLIYFPKCVTDRTGEAFSRTLGIRLGLLVFIFLAITFFLLSEAYIIILMLTRH